uniref:hypothetical protein n=1 Tax=Parerythrobacter lutipelagi TaxID=1964208 RepID=UPI0010F77E67|nr:hypothetical protein [Parerythrobacter lutipelagi]
MKYTAGAIAILAFAAAAGPAMAQSVSGTVTINGTVGEKCIVTDAGDDPNTDFGGIIDLGQLDDTDGTLRTIADIGATSDLANLGFRIVCTTASPAVSVTAAPLTTAATAPTGYANTVHFTADANFSVVGGTDTFQVVTDGTATNGGSLSNRLATGPDNVQVDLSAFHTAATTDVLVAGSYTGTVQITISPS